MENNANVGGGTPGLPRIVLAMIDATEPERGLQGSGDDFWPGYVMSIGFGFVELEFLILLAIPILGEALGSIAGEEYAGVFGFIDVGPVGQMLPTLGVFVLILVWGIVVLHRPIPAAVSLLALLVVPMLPDYAKNRLGIAWIYVVAWGLTSFIWRYMLVRSWGVPGLVARYILRRDSGLPGGPRAEELSQR